MKSGSYKGDWWFPQSPDVVTQGNLIISNDEITLETEGSLLSSNSVDLFSDIPIIHGKSRDGKFITLCSSLWMGSKSIEGFETNRYNVDYVLEGAYFASVDEIKFKTISIVPEHLDAWLWESSIDMSHDEGKTTITFQNATEKTFKINDDIKLQIFTTCGPSVMRAPLHELTIKQNSHLKLYLSDNIDLFKLIDIVRHVQNFLSFALGSPTHILSVAGEIDTSLFNKESYKVPFVDITYITITSSLSNTRVDQIKTYFRYIDVKERLSEFLKNWFDKKERLEVILNLYFKNMYTQEPYATERFMDLSRAIEIYHRKTFENKIDKKEVHEERMKKIINSIPDYKVWLKENLSFSNEKKLQTRLDEIIDRHPLTLGNSSKEAIEQFTQILRHTRNYHTHYGKPGSRTIIDSDKISRFSQGLKIILDVIILYEIGFSDSEITMLSERLKRFLKRNWMDGIVKYCEK